eukprot:215454-Chlamydomonas_euryale.AAC.1
MGWQSGQKGDGRIPPAAFPHVGVAHNGDLRDARGGAPRAVQRTRRPHRPQLLVHRGDALAQAEALHAQLRVAAAAAAAQAA